MPEPNELPGSPDELVDERGEASGLRDLEVENVALRERIVGIESETAGLRQQLEKLDRLIDELGTDPNPDNEGPDSVVKRHHAKAWEWARIANDACLDLHQLRSELTATKTRLFAALQKAYDDGEMERRRLTAMFDREAREHGGTMYDLRMKETELVTLRAALQAAEAECKAWKEAHGVFGPQRPDEVAVFNEEAQRVDAETAEHERRLQDELEIRAQTAEKTLHRAKALLMYPLFNTFTPDWADEVRGFFRELEQPAQKPVSE